MAMGVVDTIMVGHLSAGALAAVALGNLYFFGAAVFGMGVLMALDPIVAQAVGARDEPAIARAVQRGVLLSMLLTVPASVLLLTARAVLTFFSQPADVVPDAAGYALRVIPGVLPFFLFTVFRQALQAMGRMLPIVVTIVGANLTNAGLNWVLIFGHLGAPEMGVLGAAWATTVSRWLMALCILAFSWRALQQYLLPFRPEVLEAPPLGRMLALGAPIGAQYQLEFGAFGAIGLLMGWLGTIEVAAHQVALNLASLTFMVPAGVSTAGAVLVGHAVGRADAPGARRSARAVLIYGVGFMSLTALLFLGVPRALAAIYTDDARVLALAAALISIAGVFQVFDGLQVVAAGVLRGLGDTRAPMVLGLIGFWLVGIPLSLLLAFHTRLGAAGLWWGLVIGLATVALTLLARVRVRFRRDLARLVIDERPAPTPSLPITARDSSGAPANRRRAPR